MLRYPYFLLQSIIIFTISYFFYFVVTDNNYSIHFAKGTFGEIFLRGALSIYSQSPFSTPFIITHNYAHL